MATPFSPNFDPFAQQRRIMRQLVPKDPLADYHRTTKQVMAADPATRQREVMEAIAAPSRMAELGRLLHPKPVDPLAYQRRLVEQIAKHPLDEYSRVVQKMMAPIDPFAAQLRALEGIFLSAPLAQYNRIVKGFATVTGGTIATPIPTSEGAEGPQDTDAISFPLPSRTMVLHLLSIAFVCAWLIADGVDAERLGALMLAALALADHLSRFE